MRNSDRTKDASEKELLDTKLGLRGRLGYWNTPVSAAASTELATGRNPQLESEFSASGSLKDTTQSIFPKTRCFMLRFFYARLASVSVH